MNYTPSGLLPIQRHRTEQKKKKIEMLAIRITSIMKICPEYHRSSEKEPLILPKKMENIPKEDLDPEE